MTIGCPECGTVETLPPLGRRSQARCVTCRTTLERTGGRSIGAALACALATLLLLAPANLAPLLTVHLLGAERDSRLFSGVLAMWREGWGVMALLMGLFGVVLPVVRFGLLSGVLAIVQSPWRPGWLGAGFRWAHVLDLWAMPDVFLVGFFIGYSRVRQHLNAQVGVGGYCFVAAALLTMLTRATLDRRRVWRAIAPDPEAPTSGPVISCTACDLVLPRQAEGRRCPRCRLTLRARKPDAVLRAGALTLAALALYLPANLFPMTSSIQLGAQHTRRVVDGVSELFQAGLWPLGLLIFGASITIPLLKLLGMGWFIYSVRFRSNRHLVLKTGLHRLIDELGRWSNIDVFTLVIFVPLIQFGGLASARPEPGALAFTLVVFLTMCASRVFDPRLMWDAAAAREP